MRPILMGTLVVGVLDITEVIIFYAFRGVSPIRILQSVATGLLGRDAFKGGISTAILGLALHFFIAFMVVTIYYLASRRVRVLVQHPVIAGAIYGLMVYAFMNFVVLPISAAGPPNVSSWPAVANGLFAHVFCVGIPAAVVARPRPV